VCIIFFKLIYIRRPRLCADLSSSPPNEPTSLIIKTYIKYIFFFFWVGGGGWPSLQSHMGNPDKVDGSCCDFMHTKQILKRPGRSSTAGRNDYFE
jgi:hypothetical protein